MARHGMGKSLSGNNTRESSAGNSVVPGIVGLGHMGWPIAAHLGARRLEQLGADSAATGPEKRLPVHDLHQPEPLSGASQETIADSSAKAAVEPGVSTLAWCATLDELLLNCSLLFICVPDASASNDIIDRLLSLPEASVNCVVNLSTVGVDEAAALAARCEAAIRPVAYLDAPISGGQTGAINGTLTVIVSGEQHRFQHVQYWLESFAGAVFHVGKKAGQAQALKLLNNYLSAVAMAATSEAVRLGLHHDLDMAAILDVVAVSTGQNTAISDKFPKRILTESYDAGFKMALMRKDLVLYHRAVAAAQTPDQLATPILEYYERGTWEYPEGDVTELFKLIDNSLD